MRRAALLTLLVAATPVAQEAQSLSCTRAIVQVRVDDLDELAATRLGKAIPLLFAEVRKLAPPGADPLEAVLRLIRAVKPPFVLAIHAVEGGGGSMAVSLELPSDAAPLGDALREFWKGEPSMPAAVRSEGTDLVGAAMARRHGKEIWLDGVWAGRRTALVLTGSGATPETWLAALAAARGQARTERLDGFTKTLGAASVVLRFDFPALLRALPREGAAGLHILTSVLGVRFAGVVVVARAEGERMCLEGIVDVGRETGLLGRVMRAPVRLPSLLAQVPTDAEFAVFDLDPDGIGDLVRLAKPFVGETDVPIDTILEFLDTHWDGQLAMISAASTVEQAIDPDSDEPMVFLLGSRDGLKARSQLLPMLAEVGIETDESDDGKDAHRDEAWPLQVDGEILARLGAQQGFLALMAGDAGSAALFTGVLAARAQGGVGAESLPAPLRGGCSIVGRSSPLSDFSGRTAVNSLRGRELDPAVARPLAELSARLLGSAPTFGGLRVDATTLRFWSWH